MNAITRSPSAPAVECLRLRLRARAYLADVGEMQEDDAAEFLLAQIDELLTENETLRAAGMQCDTCGSSPCINPTLCARCREADRRSRQRVGNAKRPTPQTTIEALLHCVRDRGVSALKEPANIERLSRCDVEALSQIDARVAKFNRGGK